MVGRERKPKEYKGDQKEPKWEKSILWNRSEHIEKKDAKRMPMYANKMS